LSEHGVDRSLYQFSSPQVPPLNREIREIREIRVQGLGLSLATQAALE
jgi:hypothetical protein